MCVCVGGGVGKCVGGHDGWRVCVMGVCVCVCGGGGLESVWGDMMGGECRVVALHELYDGRCTCLSC